MKAILTAHMRTSRTSPFHAKSLASQWRACIFEQSEQLWWWNSATENLSNSNGDQAVKWAFNKSGSMPGSQMRCHQHPGNSQVCHHWVWWYPWWPLQGQLHSPYIQFHHPVQCSSSPLLQLQPVPTKRMMILFYLGLHLLVWGPTDTTEETWAECRRTNIYPLPEVTDVTTWG